MTEGVDEPYYCPICEEAWDRHKCFGCGYERSVMDRKRLGLFKVASSPAEDELIAEIERCWEEIETLNSRIDDFERSWVPKQFPPKNWLP